jgi:hypothetical protein
MSPDTYERICTAVEKKFGITPTVVRSERMPDVGDGENPVVILEVEGHTAVAEAPGDLAWTGIDQLLGDLEARLVRKSSTHNCPLLSVLRRAQEEQ